jgi:hypothetical protein
MILVLSPDRRVGLGILAVLYSSLLGYDAWCPESDSAEGGLLISALVSPWLTSVSDSYCCLGRAELLVPGSWQQTDPALLAG